jgi:hypothetical protein
MRHGESPEQSYLACAYQCLGALPTFSITFLHSPGINLLGWFIVAVG